MSMKIAESVLAGLAALALCACAPQEEGAPPAGSQKSYKSLPAPTRDDIATRITVADAGKTVEVGVATNIAVELIGTPTAGYIWKIAGKPEFLRAEGEAGGATSEAQREPGFAGGNHWEVFFFEVTAAGEGVLKFEQRRPWEDEGPADGTFEVTIRAL